MFGQTKKQDCEPHRTMLITMLLAMGNLGSQFIIQHLDRGLFHCDLNVVSAAVRSLGDTKHADSEEALLGHYHKSSTADTKAKVQVLRSLRKQNCTYQTASSILTSGLAMLKDESGFEDKVYRLDTLSPSSLECLLPSSQSDFNRIQKVLMVPVLNCRGSRKHRSCF
jgi:hypothetical protein